MFGDVKCWIAGTTDVRFHINAAWIKISTSDGKTVLYRREPQNDNWYDASHQEIMKAVYALEAAVRNVVPQQD